MAIQSRRVDRAAQSEMLGPWSVEYNNFRTHLLPDFVAIAPVNPSTTALPETPSP
jgi:hypothetical protein